jgi:hypothetical protein
VTKYQNGKNTYAKLSQTIPNGSKMLLKAIKYTNIYHSKALENKTKLGFLV